MSTHSTFARLLLAPIALAVLTAAMASTAIAATVVATSAMANATSAGESVCGAESHERDGRGRDESRFQHCFDLQIGLTPIRLRPRSWLLFRKWGLNPI